MKINDKKTKQIGLIILMLLYAASYISLLFNQNVWTDEAFTIQLVRENTWSQIWQATAVDVHPPLYYYIVKLFVSLFGDSLFVYKFVSVVPVLLLFLLAYTKVRKLAGEDVAILFVIFVNAIPCILEYVVQIRMYSWAFVFVTWAGISAYEFCVKQKWSSLVALTLASICACYTHNYAMLACVYIYVLVGAFMLREWFRKKDNKGCMKWLLSGVIVAVCYLPWLLVLYQQTTDRIGNYWIEEVSYRSILEYIEFLFGSCVPYSEGMFIVLCFVAVVLCIRNKATSGIWAFSVMVAVAAVGIIVSVLVTPFFIARYLLPCLGLVAVFFAIAFQKEKVVTKCLIGAFGIVMFSYSYYANFEAEYKSSHTQELLDYLDANMGENDYIIYNNEMYGFIYDIYFDSDRTVFLNDMDFSSDFDTIWYFDSCVGPWLATQTVESFGLQKEFVANLGIEQNDFALYRITERQDR